MTGRIPFSEQHMPCPGVTPSRFYAREFNEDHGHTTLIVCGQVSDVALARLVALLTPQEPPATHQPPQDDVVLLEALREEATRLRDVVLGVAALTAAWEGEAVDCEPHPDWATARARDQRRHLSTLRAVVAGLRRVIAPGLPDPTAAPVSAIAASAPLTLAGRQDLVAEVTAAVRRHPGTPVGSALVWDVVEVVADAVRAQELAAVYLDLRRAGHLEAARMLPGRPGWRQHAGRTA